MNSSTFRKPGLIAAAAATSALVVLGVPLAVAVPTAVPPSDSQGYVDSTARCTKPDTAVIFGTTDTSRVAVCKTSGGAYEYRGVRVSDGAKLIVTASQTADGDFIAKNDGVTYTVTATSLSISAGGSTIRTESWTDINTPQSPATSNTGTTKTSTPKTSTAPTTSGTTTSGTTTSGTTTAGTTSPTTSATAAASPSATSSAPKTSAAQPSSAMPLPPPLPAEAGGGSSSGS
jgi:hypothetical protein